MPRGYRLQARLELRPDIDRLIARVVNVSDRTQMIDVETVHEYNVYIAADDPGFKMESGREYTGYSDGEVITREGCVMTAPRAPVLGVERLEKNPVRLGPGEYIAYSPRLSRMPIFKPLRAALLRSRRSGAWKISFSVRARAPGPSGKPVVDEVLLSSNSVPVTKGALDAALRAGRKIDLRLKASGKGDPVGDVDSFEGYLGLSTRTGELTVDVVCINPRPGRVENGGWVPQGSRIDMATLSEASCRWYVKAGGQTLYESEEAEGGDDGEGTETNRSLVLEKHQMVGRIVRLSKSPMLTTIERFFEDRTDRGAKCSLGIRLHFYLSGEEGKPRREGELVSNEITVTREDYKKIIEAPSSRAPTIHSRPYGSRTSRPDASVIQLYVNGIRTPRRHGGTENDHRARRTLFSP